METMQKNIEKVAKFFNKNKVEYMFIGKGGAIIQGYNDTTQDIDVYPKKSVENSQKIIKALKQIGFKLDNQMKEDIFKGKDFIQFKVPFEFDLVFGPDGFNKYEEALKYKKQVGSFPVMSIVGIIKSKEAANRPKDRESISRLKYFKEYLSEKGFI